MAAYDDQGFIVALEPKDVMVFGSNLSGRHLGGAARQAHEQFGAEWGVGEGLTGQSYAFPTLDDSMERVSTTRLKMARLNLYKTAEAHPELTFYLTKVGTGIAGFTEERMKAMFRNAPANVVLPEDWR